MFLYNFSCFLAAKNPNSPFLIHGISTSELFLTKILTNYCRGRFSRPDVAETKY